MIRLLRRLLATPESAGRALAVYQHNAHRERVKAKARAIREAFNLPPVEALK